MNEDMQCENTVKRQTNSKVNTAVICFIVCFSLSLSVVCVLGKRDKGNNKNGMIYD